MKLSSRQFDDLEYSEVVFYHKMIRKSKEEKENLMMRQAAFITYSSGAGGNKSYEAYLSSLGLIHKTNRMSKTKKKAIATKAHSNASKIFEMLRKKKK